jgi:hypothetical protein
MEEILGGMLVGILMITALISIACMLWNSPKQRSDEESTSGKRQNLPTNHHRNNG